jgi:coenzyme Q-binding protein COQ10
MQDKPESRDASSWRVRRKQSHSLIIPASREKCWAVITDFERYPKWISRIESAKILNRYPDGKGKIVEFVLDIFIRKVRYVLDYTYDEKNFLMEWTYVEGDLKNATGEFRFEIHGEGQANAYYFNDVEANFYAPDIIKDLLAKRTMREVLHALKAEVLQRG